MKERLIEALLQLPGSKKTGSQSEIIIRCPWCGDSPNPNHQHHYIGFNDNAIVHHCKLCSSAGVLTSDGLRKIGIYDREIHEYIKSVSMVSNALVKVNGQKDSSYNYKIITKISLSDEAKIQYFYDRVGIDIHDQTNIESYRIILNLKEFLNKNKLVSNINNQLLDEVSDHFIGFLSQNQNVISFRNVSSSMEERYIHYKIDQNKRLPFIYIPPCSIDILTQKPQIILAEGAFDIICVQKQFYPSDTTDSIFCATGSIVSFKNILMRAVSLTGFFGARVIIYSDFDKKWKQAGIDKLINYYKEDIFKAYLDLFKFQIVVNMDPEQKDFGYLSSNWSIKKFNIN